MALGLKYSIHIGLHLRDKLLLEFIKNNLNNIGTIYNYEKKNESHLAIVKIEELKWLIDNIFSQNFLLTKHQFNRFEILKNGILNNIKSFKTEEELNKYLINVESLNLNKYLNLVCLPALRS